MGVKDVRKNTIVERAIKLFCQQSIMEVKIKDVADACDIGEATFYRYFSRRRALVMACALKLSERMCELFEDNQSGSGFERLSRFYYRFYEIFGDHAEYYRFLSEFDAYCINEELTVPEEYSDNLDIFKERFVAAYKDGLADGSVKKVWDLDLFYYSTTHAMLSLCKKLATEAYIVRQDDLTDKRQEVRLVIEVILSSLKND